MSGKRLKKHQLTALMVIINARPTRLSARRREGKPVMGRQGKRGVRLLGKFWQEKEPATSRRERVRKEVHLRRWAATRAWAVEGGAGEHKEREM